MDAQKQFRGKFLQPNKKDGESQYPAHHQNDIVIAVVHRHRRIIKREKKKTHASILPHHTQ